MLVSVEYKNNSWTITDYYSGKSVSADALIGDFEFVQGNRASGTVVAAHGVPLEQASRIPQNLLRGFGIQGVPRKGPPPRGFRRMQCMPGGKIEPYNQNA